MEELESLKFSFVEDNTMLMLDALATNQNFLRFSQYLLNSPLENVAHDKDGNEVSQPDIITDGIGLVSNKIIFLTLFNPTIITEEKIYMFFSPFEGKNEEGQPLMHNLYIFDFIIPYSSMIMYDNKQRIFKIANEICRSWDNQYIGGVGKTIMYKWKTAPVNAIYQGMKLYFKIDDSAFTD